MIPYTYESLFLTDSTEKQMTITDGDEITLTNAEIYQEEFELHESLCSSHNLDFGACESSYIKFTTSYLSPLKNKVLTVSEVLTTHVNDPFTFGTYKVVDDKLTADRTKREVTAYDALYDVINSDVLDWYNTILPDSETTVTLKQFRDSFFSHFGITQETITLPNDSETISKTIITNKLSGRDVLHAICEMNGCFGRINRENKFEYVYVYGKKGLYPSQTLFPSNKIYPSVGGGADPYEVGENGTYISCTFEDYSVQRINKLVIKGSENDVGVTVGTGDNVYTIIGNFLLYDTDNLENIAQKIYQKISNVYYRPCDLEAIGNPCLEVGDSIEVNTRDRNVFSLIMQRTLKGVQALKDTYIATGDEERDEGLNTFNEQMVRIKGQTNTLERTLDHTISELTDFEQETQTTLEQYSDRIDAKVSKNSPTGQTSFSWEMTDTQQEWKANGNRIMNLDTNGLEISGKITATSGYIGNGANGFTINNTAIYNGMTSLADTTNNGIYVGTDGIALGKGNFKVDSSGNLTAKAGYIGNGSSGFTIGSTSIYNGMTSYSDTTHDGIYVGTDGIALGKGVFKVSSAGRVTAKDLTIPIGGRIYLNSSGPSVPNNSNILMVKNDNVDNGYFSLQYDSFSLYDASTANPRKYISYNHSSGLSTNNDITCTGNYVKAPMLVCSKVQDSATSLYTHLTLGSSYVTLGASAGQKIGFFGSQGAYKQTISQMITFTESICINKINEILNALKTYGLIYSS